MRPPSQQEPSGIVMDIVPNHTKRQLASGGLALGMGVRNSRTVDIATVARTCDFDWLFIDMEHSSLDVDLASQLAMASLGAGISPIVRIPGHEHYHASRLLDNGAQGIVAPHVDTVEEAQRIVAACRYPPQGKRSAGATPPPPPRCGATRGGGEGGPGGGRGGRGHSPGGPPAVTRRRASARWP